MKIDLCTLTEDLLPLYADDLLSPATRQLLEQHMAECPACRERLREGAAPQPPPIPSEPPRLERPALAFFGRLRRFLFGGLAVAVALMVAVGGFSYTLGRQSRPEARRIPVRVAGAEAVAVRAIPGWERATAAGLVIDLTVTERIPGTEATITLEKAWYSARQVYVLYTVKAPEGGYWLPTEASLTGDDPAAGTAHGRTEWANLSTWGGFSPEGFHGVLTFGWMPDVADSRHLRLTLHQFAPVTPETGLVQSRSIWEDVTALLPWEASYLVEPPPDVIPWPERHTWLGRTLVLDQLVVGVGRVQLTGEIILPEGERDPSFYATLLVGPQELGPKDYEVASTAESGRYRFTVTYDGPNQWPAPVRLHLRGIEFVSDQVLEWPVHWAKYRHLTGAERRLMDPEDQVTVQFYDSQLISIYTTDSGVSIEQRDPDRPAPYVRAALRMGGRGIPPDLGPGFEVENDHGEVMTNLGGGAGVIYDNLRGSDQRQGVAVMWWEELPDSFRQSERLIIRYVHPSAVLVLDETWTLPTER